MGAASFSAQQKMLSEAGGVKRERDFPLPIQKDDPTVENYFKQSNGKGEVMMKLDNDAQGRADDIYSLQVKSGLAANCLFPVCGAIWCCDDNRDCCQAFPGGCTFCCECCECFERHPTEIHSANSHRLTLYSNCLVFERDAHDRPIVTHWTTVDKYGNVSHHQGERMRHATQAKFHMPLESVRIEVVDMKILPQPIYVSNCLVCLESCCGEDEVKPKGSILAVRLTNSTRKILCCIDCGQNSNALAFKKAFEDAKARNTTLAPPQVTQAFETQAQTMQFQQGAGTFQMLGSLMAATGGGNNMAMMQQQMMMARMNRMNMMTNQVQQAPMATATAIPMNTTIPVVTATTVDSAPTAPPKDGMMPNSSSNMNTTASSEVGNLSSQLNQLAQLHQSGALSDSEYQAAKSRILGIGQ